MQYFFINNSFQQISPEAHLVLLILHHILCHLEGAQVLIHALQFSIICSILVPV